MELNKKLIYLFAVLVTGLFVISSCSQDAVGIRTRNLETGGYYTNTFILATGETIASEGRGGWSIKLLSVEVNGRSCAIEYNRGMIYNINRGSAITTRDGTNVGVTNVIVSNRQGTPDRCEVSLSF